jgi:hypothetical protein
MHGPNEKFHLPNFLRGIASVATFLDEIAALHATGRLPDQGRLEVTAQRPRRD